MGSLVDIRLIDLHQPVLFGIISTHGDRNRVESTFSVNKVKEIAEMKMEDLNCHDIEAAIKVISGTARSMGIEVK